MDNLTIQISADSTKLRADLLLAQAEVRKFSSDVNKNVRAGDTAGAATNAATAALATEKMIGLKAAIAGSGAETLTLSKRLSDVGRELEHVRGQFHKEAVENMHGGSATLSQSVPVGRLQLRPYLPYIMG